MTNQAPGSISPPRIRTGAENGKHRSFAGKERVGLWNILRTPTLLFPHECNVIEISISDPRAPWVMLVVGATLFRCSLGSNVRLPRDCGNPPRWFPVSYPFFPHVRRG